MCWYARNRYICRLLPEGWLTNVARGQWKAGALGTQFMLSHAGEGANTSIVQLVLAQSDPARDFCMFVADGQMIDSADSCLRCCSATRASPTLAHQLVGLRQRWSQAAADALSLDARQLRALHQRTRSVSQPGVAVGRGQGSHSGNNILDAPRR